MADVNFYSFAEEELKATLLANTVRINGKLEGTVDPYVHVSKFMPVYTDSGEWETFSTLDTRIMADVIALDSPFPIKTRPAVELVKGKIEKIATKRTMNETEQTKIRRWLMSSDQRLVQRGIDRIVADAVSCQNGIHETWEAMVYQALSNEGTAIFAPIDDTAAVAAGAKDNVGLGVRINYGFLPEQMLNYGVAPWSDPTTSTPIDDITRVIDMANEQGIRITEANTNRATINRLLASNQLKQAMAAASGMVGALAFNPTLTQANAYFLSTFGFIWVIRDHRFISQRDGKNTPQDMWTDGAIAFMADGNWGDLVWTECVEMYEPADGYAYNRPEDPILIGLYREKLNSTSWMKITEGQSIGMPVINPANIITLDTLNPAA